MNSAANSAKQTPAAVQPRHTAARLGQLLRSAAEDHHQAFASVGGADPNWATFYAGHLIEDGVHTGADTGSAQADLAAMLTTFDAEYRAQPRHESWDRYYARKLVDGLSQLDIGL